MKESPINKKEGFKISGNWEYQSKLLQDKFPQLTEDDIKFEKGKENELLSRLKEKLKMDGTAIIEIINQADRHLPES